MAFSETPRFPVDISYGAVGGPMFKTLVSANDGGYEQRLARWGFPLHVYDVSQGAKTQDDIDTLKQFFMNKQGMLTGFRFKDWSDYDVVVAESSMVYSFGGIYQLGKTYTTGASSSVRTLKKIVDTTYAIYKDAVLQTEGAAAGQYSIDITTGIVDFQPDSSKNIVGITQASPAEVTTSLAHGFSSTETVELSGITGMTELNGQTVTVTSTGANTFTIGVDTTSYTAYSGSGTADQYAQPSVAVTWSGEFDVPVRFGVDQMQVSIVDKDILTWAQIPLVELREST